MSQVQHPAAFCKSHGLFPATGFAMEPGSSASFFKCLTNCPSCNADCEILPGTYNAFKDRIDVLLRPSVSAEAIAALRTLAEGVRDNRIALADAKKEAEKIAPGAGRLFEGWGDQAKATLAAGILSALAIIAAARLSASSTNVNVNVQPVIERIVPVPQKCMPLPGLPGGVPLKHKLKGRR